ncbi:hypothetical protein EV363DRAFT_1273672, partial [Boletus edulis]
PALLVLACFSAPALPPFPFRCLAAHFPWVRSARTRLLCTCACEAAHAPPGKSGSRPRPKSAPRSAHPLPLSSIRSLSASSSRRPRVQSDVQRNADSATVLFPDSGRV